jgi:hypothetical protein
MKFAFTNAGHTESEALLVMAAIRLYTGTGVLITIHLSYHAQATPTPRPLAHILGEPKNC